MSSNGKQECLWYYQVKLICKMMPMQVHFTLNRFPQIKNFECFYCSEMFTIFQKF